MATTLTSKGQVTIPKQIRDALNLAPGCSVDFAVNREGDVVIHKVGARPSRKPDRFEAARGKADVKWRTDDLMALLPDPAGECPPDELHAEVLRGLDELPPQEAALLRCSFGIGQPAMTRAATADRLGLSVSTTRRLELKALSRLRRLLLSAEAA